MTRLLITVAALFPSLLVAAEALPLKSDEYTLIQLQVANHPDVNLPHDIIPNDQYRLVKKPKVLSFQFSENRKEVKIPSLKVSGKLRKVDGNKRYYELTKGLFGGGSLTIEKNKSGLTATFTVFGSGVPVITSSRGDFQPTEPKS